MYSNLSANTAITIGSTVITSSVPATSLTGLTSVAATTLVGSLTGTATNAVGLNGQAASYYLLTSNISEGTNLYFTSSRVLTTTLTGLSTATNAVISSSDTVLSGFGKLQAQITANSVLFNGQSASYYLLTSNMTEGTNLFFTNTRAEAAALIAPLTGLSTATNAIISSSDTVLSGFGKLQAQISTLTLSGSPVSSVNSQTGSVVLTTSNIAESSNLYFTNTRAEAATLIAPLTGLSTASAAIITASDTVLSAAGKLQAQITTNSTLLNGQTASYYLLTTNMTEGTNLFFTNARAEAAALVAPLTGLSTASSSTITASDTVLSAAGKLQAQITTITTGTINATTLNGQTASYYLSTSNMVEGTNLFFTNTRAEAATLLAILTGLSTATNAIISSSDTVLSAAGKLQAQITANSSMLNGQVASYYLLTSNMTEGTNLFFTNTRAEAAALIAPLTGLSTATSTVITSSDTVLSAAGKLQAQITTVAGSIGNATTLNGQAASYYLLTSNMTEGTNLFFTNARAEAATLIAPLTGFTSTVGGTITSSDTVISALQKLQYREAANDAKITYPGPPTFAQVTSKPTTIAGYGLTDALSITGTAADSSKLGGVAAASYALTSAIPASTSTLSEGSNLYFTNTRAEAATLIAPLTGLSTATSTVITALDTVLSGFGKIQAQISGIVLPTWSTLSGIPANIINFSLLSNTAGYLYNNGSGSFSYAIPSSGSVGFGGLNCGDSGAPTSGAAGFNCGGSI